MSPPPSAVRPSPPPSPPTRVYGKPSPPAADTPPPAWDPPPGAPELPGYDLLEEIGRGGFGVVYKARDRALDRTVAVKVLLSGVLTDPDVRARFRLEARAAAKLRHPNIVQVHEFADAGTPFVVMEYVPGPTLAAFAAGGPLEPRWTAAIVAAVARAIHAAHAAGVVHRDLKPANVLLQIEDVRLKNDGGGSPQSSISHLQSHIPKVTDFGLAKLLAADAGLTASGHVAGTPGYMAPEQVGGSGVVGPWTDVFALGAILYELLTGRRAFAGNTPPAVMTRTLLADPERPRRVRPELPRDLETVCLKCLEKDPLRRYPTAEALADDLDRFLAGRSVLARPSGPAERAWKLARRHPVSTGLAAGLLVALAAGFAVSTRLYLQAEDRRRDAEAAAEAKDAALRAMTERQADVEALNAFVTGDLLAAARPKGFQTRGLGPGTTVKEALDVAGGKIDERFATRPRVGAGAHLTLGETYRQLGEYAAALKHLRRAVELWEAHGTDDPARLANARRYLAVTLTRIGRADEAVPLFRAAVPELDRAGEALLAAQTRRDLALCLLTRGELDEAVALLTEAHAELARLRGPDSPDALGTLTAVGSAHLRADRADRAESVGREVVARAAAAHGPDSLVTGYGHMLVGKARAKMQDWDGAEAALRRAADIHAAVAGPNHPDSLELLNQLAKVLWEQRRLAELERRLRPAAGVARTALGPTQPTSLALRLAFVRVLAAWRHELAEAERVAAELVADCGKLPADHADRKEAEKLLAEVREMRTAPPPREVPR